MELNKMVYTIITLSVVVISVAAIMMPVLADATESTATFENDGYFHMTKYDTSTDVTIEWDHSTPTYITVNGEAYNIDTPTNKWVSLIVGNNWYFRYADASSVQYTQTTYGGTSNLSANTSNGMDIKIVCSGGTATATLYSSGVAGDSQTVSYTELYAISGDDGDYVMKITEDTVTMGADSEFVALGNTGTGDYNNIIRIDGSIEDGATVTVVATTASTATISDETVNATALSSYVDGYKLSTITFTITADGTEYDATYSYFIVPAEVTLELAEHLSSGAIALINAIPALVLVSLVMVAVGLSASKRDD